MLVLLEIQHMLLGEILYKGKPIQKMPGHKIARLGLSQVLEGRHIFSKLTVYENLMTGAYCRKDKKNLQHDIKEVYKLFPRLEERRNQLGGTLSGGEQQMLAIARSMLSKPDLMLLDEPSLAWPIVVKEILNPLKSGTGTSIFFVEQNSK